jgi:hypothetical protein
MADMADIADRADIAGITRIASIAGLGGIVVENGKEGQLGILVFRNFLDVAE